MRGRPRTVFTNKTEHQVLYRLKVKAEEVEQSQRIKEKLAQAKHFLGKWDCSACERPIFGRIVYVFEKKRYHRHCRNYIVNQRRIHNARLATAKLPAVPFCLSYRKLEVSEGSGDRPQARVLLHRHQGPLPPAVHPACSSSSTFFFIEPIG